MRKSYSGQKINANHSIFFTSAGLDTLVVSTFIDDIKIMASKDSKIILQIKSELAAIFSIVDIGPISFYLGLKVQCD